MRPLQQACVIETERGFINLLGREETFHSFMSRELLSQSILNKQETLYQRLNELSSSYTKYPEESIVIKQRLVIRTRQFLQYINKEFCRINKKKNHSLNLNQYDLNPKLSQIKNKCNLESPISDVPGINKKIIEKLSFLGIFLIEKKFQLQSRK